MEEIEKSLKNRMIKAIETLSDRIAELILAVKDLKDDGENE